MSHYYTISNLPDQIDTLLYDYQRAEILKRIKAPIVTVLANDQDPEWLKLDPLLTRENHVLSLSKSGEVECTIHEILPGASASWIMENHGQLDEQSRPAEAILINATDLQIVTEGGIDALIQHHLFKEF